jgi:hypothetical protein
MPSFRFASATGSGSSLIVTCSDQFAGKTITCTNGTKTYTRTCPSTSPYEVVFKGVAPGTWTVSGVVEGQTYSQQVVITDFDVILTAGFDYKQWVTLGGLDPTDYASLSEVFTDEVAVRRLMTIHASADYLIEKVTDDIDTIDDFVANDTAMKWIGLRDYVCDGLTSITGVEAKFLASQYWERYLKDHVPVMTSNTAPYGTAFVFGGTEDSSNPAWKVFDNDTSTVARVTPDTNTRGVGYKFVNPISIHAFRIFYKAQSGVTITVKVQYSDNGSTYSDATDALPYISASDTLFKCDDVGYHFYWRIVVTTSSAAAATCASLQFYGRALNETVTIAPTDGRPYKTIGNVIYTVSWSEKEFEEGTTKKWLYDHGVELETFTYSDNGFGTYSHDKSNSLYVKMNKTSTTNNSAGGYLIDNTIDFSAYSDLYFIGFCNYCGSSNPYAGIGVGNSSAFNNGYPTNSTIAKNIGEKSLGKYNLDISSINGNYYVGCGMFGLNGTVILEFSEIWLE